MVDVEIYSGFLCGYCISAKRLLRRKKVEFREINVSLRPWRRMEMIRRAGGRRTVPQIFLNGRHIGGCEELFALDAIGKLDSMLDTRD
ncbi:MAG: glutaredoxin 3 [Rhodospirillaceae bacterium]|nr:MAG: glutaredoxin 3 [Rhodospirillaceae bacterium]